MILVLVFVGFMVGGGAAALMLPASGFLARLFALPQGLIFWAGMLLVPVVLFLAAMARRDSIPRSWLREIVFINWVWVVASAALLLLAPIEPTPLGVLFIVAQALAVAAFAILEGMALRRRPQAQA